MPDDDICSEERDGFVFMDADNQITLTCDVPFTVEEYPAAAEVMNFAKKKYPHLDFDRKAQVSMDTFYWSRR